MQWKLRGGFGGGWELEFEFPLDPPSEKMPILALQLSAIPSLLNQHIVVAVGRGTILFSFPTAADFVGSTHLFLNAFSEV